MKLKFINIYIYNIAYLIRIGLKYAVSIDLSLWHINYVKCE